jgi:hypothetical protein
MFSRIFIRIVATACTGFLVVIGSGCASIQSESVRGLIDFQGKHIRSASDKADDLTKQTKERTDNYRSAVKDLNQALRSVQQDEAKQTLIFSANQNISTKTGVDANAAAYVVAALYFAEYAGLQKEVTDQFESDFKALESLAVKVKQSWVSLLALHVEIENYAKQSGLAGVDPNFISALLNQTKIDSEDIDRVIKSSKQVNALLSKASQLKVLSSDAADRDKKVINDVIDLLDRIKKTPAK